MICVHVDVPRSSTPFAAFATVTRSIRTSSTELMCTVYDDTRPAASTVTSWSPDPVDIVRSVEFAAPARIVPPSDPPTMVTPAGTVTGVISLTVVAPMCSARDPDAAAARAAVNAVVSSATPSPTTP